MIERRFKDETFWQALWRVIFGDGPKMSADEYEDKINAPTIRAFQKGLRNL